MACPLGRVKTRAHPLMVAEPVLAIVMFAVRPVFHGLTVYVTRHRPGCEVEVAVVVVVGGCEVVVVGGRDVVVVGGRDVVVEVGGVLSPKNSMAMRAWPPNGRL